MDRMREHSVKPHQGMFRLDSSGKKVFSESVIGHWNGLLGEVMDSLFLEMYQKWLDEALNAIVDNMVFGHRLYIVISKVFFNLGNSVIL